MNESMILMSKSRGSHGEAGWAVQQGVKRPLEIPEHWQESSGHWLLLLLKADWAHPPQVHGEVYEGQRVCAVLDISTDCSAVVFISSIPAVAQGIFWQPGPPGQLGISR